jgi:AraC family transcriptional activator of pobA
MRHLHTFERNSKPVYRLSERQYQEMTTLFEKMLDEAGSDYLLRFDLLRNLVSEITHLALKIQPDENIYHHPDTNARITSIFIHLLERQFPIQSREQYFIDRRHCTEHGLVYLWGCETRSDRPDRSTWQMM